MSSKYMVYGALIGILAGILSLFIFPALISKGLMFNREFNQGMENPADAVPSVVMIFGVVGAGIGAIYFRLRKK